MKLILFKKPRLSPQMSVQYGHSDLLEQLPVSAEPIRPEEFARLAPLLDEGSKAVRPLRRYLIAWVLFVVFSLKFMDTLLVRASPTLAQLGYGLVVVRGALFVMLLYILDNLLPQK